MMLVVLVVGTTLEPWQSVDDFKRARTGFFPMRHVVAELLKNFGNGKSNAFVC